MNEIVFVTLNGIAYLILFVWYCRKVRYINLGVFMLFLWALSALGAILYEPLNFIGHRKNITLEPYIYLYVLNFIMFLPVLIFRDDLLGQIKVNPTIIQIISIVIGLLSLLPFVENTLYAFSHSDQEGLERLQELMTERYQDGKVALAYMSFPAKICYRLLTYIGINVITLLFFIYPLVFPIKKCWLTFLGVIMANLTLILQGYCMMARFMIFIQLVMLLSVFVVLRKFYTKDLMREIKRWCGIGGGCVAVVFFIMTVSRLNNFTDSTKQSLSVYVYVGQYMSESMGNFNANMWPTDKYVDSDRFKYAIERYLLRSVKARDRNVESAHLGYSSAQFYTSVGDYYKAYGKYLTVLIVIASSLFFMKLFKRKKTITFSTLLLFLFYARLCLLGFCFNTYAVSSEEFVAALFLIPLYRFFETGRLLAIRKQKY